jgi:hypothetical protein
MELTGLYAKWWLRIGSDSKPRTELEFLWSLVGILQSGMLFQGSFGIVFVKRKQ